MSVRIFRVTVRGQFGELDEATRSRLIAEAPDHDFVTQAAFTRDGTFSYEPNLIAFSFRYEVRVDEGGDAVEPSIAAAAKYLHGHGIPSKHIRATATDMATMWRPSRDS